MKDYFSNLPQKFDQITDIAKTEKTRTVTAVPVSASPAVPMELLDITKETIRCFTDYAKCTEHEKTERKRILATLKAIELQINSQKEAFLKMLDMHYEERNKLYTLAEDVMQKALMENDKELLIYCCNFILNIYNGNAPIDPKKIFPMLSTNDFDNSKSF